jgi:hypothetical protein
LQRRMRHWICRLPAHQQHHHHHHQQQQQGLLQTGRLCLACRLAKPVAQMHQQHQQQH